MNAIELVAAIRGFHEAFGCDACTPVSRCLTSVAADRIEAMDNLMDMEGNERLRAALDGAE